MGRQDILVYGRNDESFTNGLLDMSIGCMTARNKTVELQIMGEGWIPCLFKHLLRMFLRMCLCSIFDYTFFSSRKHHILRCYMITPAFRFQPIFNGFRGRLEGRLWGSTRNAETWGKWLHHPAETNPVDHLPGLPRYVSGHVHPARNTTGDTLKVHAAPKEGCEPASIGAWSHSRCQR